MSPIVPPDAAAIEWARALDRAATRHDQAATQAERDAASREINALILDDERMVQVARALLESEAALLAMFLDAESIAVSSHETCTYPGGVFDDQIWHDEDPDGFEVACRARQSLGLKPFLHRDARNFGLAGDRLAEFRSR